MHRVSKALTDREGRGGNVQADLVAKQRPSMDVGGID